MTFNRLRTAALAASFLAGTTLGALAQGTGGASNTGAGGPMDRGTTGGAGQGSISGPATSGSAPMAAPSTTGTVRTIPGGEPNVSTNPSGPCAPGQPSSSTSSAGGPSATRC